eukprot:scaffold253_cov72-Cylindrotheca_fusiformis.AAC.2
MSFEVSRDIVQKDRINLQEESWFTWLGRAPGEVMAGPVRRSCLCSHKSPAEYTSTGDNCRT